MNKITKTIVIITAILGGIYLTINSSNATTTSSTLHSIYSALTSVIPKKINNSDTLNNINGKTSVLTDTAKPNKSSNAQLASLTTKRESNHAWLKIKHESIALNQESSKNITSNGFYPDDLLNNSIIYISENETNKIIVCNVDGRNLVNCQTALSGLSGPQNILVVDKKIYILNLNNANITTCNLKHNGKITSCINMLLPIKAPSRIIYDNHSLYISDFSVKAAVRCDLENNGSIIGCNNISGSINPLLFTFTTYNGYAYDTAYMVNAINKCTNPADKLSCNLIEDASIKQPLTIKFFNNYAYISGMTESTTNTTGITSCAILANGDFAECMQVANNFKLSIGIAGFTTSKIVD